MIILIGLLLSVITAESESIQREKAAGNAEQRARQMDQGPASFEADENEEGKSAEDIWEIVKQSTIYGPYCEKVKSGSMNKPILGVVCDPDDRWTMEECCKDHTRLPLWLQDCLRGIHHDAFSRVGYNRDPARVKEYRIIIASSGLPFCNNEGRWETTQCSTTKCWCVEWYTGKTIENSYKGDRPVNTWKPGDKKNKENCNLANFYRYPKKRHGKCINDQCD